MLNIARNIIYVIINISKRLKPFFFILLCITSVRMILENFHRMESKTGKYSSNFKYILLWLGNKSYPENDFKTGQQAFIESNCPISNCLVTDRKNYFGVEDSVELFDAIIFNGYILHSEPSELPRKRSPHQIYIFSNMESADSMPMCNPVFDSFFNWTMTHKLNSDIVFSYLLVLNSTGHEVGPKTNMTWYQSSAVNENFRNSLKTKSKAVAWLVSHCYTRSKREIYARMLKEELEKKNLVLDIYGLCSGKTCPNRYVMSSMCNDMLQKSYYFYLAFENSMHEDYVTEKVLIALHNNVVPIVFGGANYTRFLPPGSYLNARQHTPGQLASIIAHLISNPDEYAHFFSWRNRYKFRGTDGSAGSDNKICKLCAALNDETKVNMNTHKVYQDFRSWWDPNYEHRCEEEI